MKLSELKELVKEYDSAKGLRRRLFGDAAQIQVLKKFIADRELFDINNDADVTVVDYQNFARERGYNVDLSDNYLATNSASAQIFNNWKLNDQMMEIIRIPSFEFTPIAFDVTRYQTDTSAYLSELLTRPFTIHLAGQEVALDPPENPVTQGLQAQLQEILGHSWLRNLDEQLFRQNSRHTFFRPEDLFRAPRPRREPRENHRRDMNTDNLHRAAPAA